MTDENARASEAVMGAPEVASGEQANFGTSDGEDTREAQLAREAADLKDRLLRSLAEMENLRRRTEREVADARAYGMANFARDMLAVADNMRRAVEAATKEGPPPAGSGLAALVEGIELTEREFFKTLEKHDVRRIEPLGQKFDPNLQQAMFEIPDPSVAPGTVVQVMQSGYTIGERILRPALVGVAKGGAKPAPETGEPPANDNANAGSAASS